MARLKTTYLSGLIKIFIVVSLSVLNYKGWSQPTPGDSGLSASSGHPVGGGAPLDSALEVLFIAAIVYIMIKYFHLSRLLKLMGLID